MPICGPKLSICGMVISVWGIIMLLLMGVFLKIGSPAFIEDMPIDHEEWAKGDEAHGIDRYDPQYVMDLYNQSALNCFIAAALYVGVFVFSLIQHRLNLRATYMTT